MAELSIRGARKSFRSGSEVVAALNGVDLELRSGELLALLGPSGCGKTTLLKCVAGLEKLDGGDLHFNRQDWSGTNPKERNVSMAFQQPALLPQMTVVENVAFPLQLRNISKAERLDQAREFLALAGIPDLADRLPESLSGGEMARVALARALITRPSLLLLDEPLGSLDAPTRRILRRVIKEIQRKTDVPCLFVTHDQEEALALGDRIAVMREGMIEQIGTTDEMYNLPASLFVAAFLSRHGMNKFEGELPDFGGVGVRTEAISNASSEKPLELIACVRPEQIRITEKSPWKVVIEEVENLGSEQMLYCKDQGREWLVRNSTNEVYVAGTSIRLEISPRDWHIFEKRSGRRI